MLTQRLQRLLWEMLRRARRLRLQQTAASLAFLSLFAAVPILSIALSVLSILPVFDRLQEVVQQFLLRNLFPETFSETVMRHLQEFAERAHRLSVAGAIVFFTTAITSLRVIETTLNAIWATTRRRSPAHRFALYWALLTLAPLALAAVLALNGRVIGALLSDSDLLWIQSMWFAALPWLIGAAGLWLMFFLLPATRVSTFHALLGALVSGVLLAALQRGLGWSVQQLPTYEVVYGAFAALPLLLIWLFLAWAAVLAGALLAASLRHWDSPLEEPDPENAPGGRFEDALTVLRTLWRATDQTAQPDATAPFIGAGVSVAVSAGEVRQAFGGDAQRAEQTAELLERLGYVIRLVHLSGRSGAAYSSGRSRSGGTGLAAGVWSERWAWSSSPPTLTLRALFDELWWAGQPALASSWQSVQLDVPLPQALAP
jgi:membrane protein